jgi:hypothetical protein
MKKHLRLMTLVLIAIMAAGSASAQSHNPATTVVKVPTTTSVKGNLKVAIPFGFSVGGEQFSAGEYWIEPLSEKALTIKSIANGTARIALTNSVETGSNQPVSPRLVFHRYGTEYFLAQVWIWHSDSGREFSVSPQERTLRGTHKQEQIVALLEH